jgi:tRNA pseudouridine55 synthase
LIVGVGREATKKLGRIAKDTKKTYVAEIFLGEERDTDDIEGKTQNSKVKSQKYIPKTKILEVVNSFVGRQEQVPPAYSAIKIKGKKAYELARKGEKVRLGPRKIVIYSIKLMDYKYPILKIKVIVSAGTYIRALARDIGRKLGCGAHLKNLRRTKIGKFSINLAVPLSFLTKDNWRNCVF